MALRCFQIPESANVNGMRWCRGVQHAECTNRHVDRRSTKFHPCVRTAAFAVVTAVVLESRRKDTSHERTKRAALHKQTDAARHVQLVHHPFCLHTRWMIGQSLESKKSNLVGGLVARLVESFPLRISSCALFSHRRDALHQAFSCAIEVFDDGESNGRCTKM